MKHTTIFLTLVLISAGCTPVQPAESIPEAATALTVAADPSTGLVPSSGQASALPAGFPSYQNHEFGFGLDLPPDAFIDEQAFTYAAVDDYVHVNLTVTPGTTLTRKEIYITVVRGADPCLSPEIVNIEPAARPVTFNDTPFLKQSGVGAAAGTTVQATAYSTSRDGICVSVIFSLFSFDPRNLAPEVPTPPAFDITGESAIFESVISTFTWLEP